MSSLVMSSSDIERPQFNAWVAKTVASERRLEAEVDLRVALVVEAALTDKADAKATSIYAQAYGRDFAFHEFWKSMETLQELLELV